MKHVPYIIALMATRRKDPFGIERRIFLDSVSAPSDEDAKVSAMEFFLSVTEKTDKWTNPSSKVLAIPEPQILHYRSEIQRAFGKIHWLTSLWAYAAFFPDRGGLRLGTIIAPTRQIAETELKTRLKDRRHDHAEGSDYLIRGVHPKLVLPQPIDPEDRDAMMRLRFERSMRGKK